MQDELDILREVGSISAAHGSLALSEILGRKIALNIPSLDVVIPQEIHKTINLGTMCIAILSKILVGLKGEVAFILDEKNAFKLINLSYILKDEKKKAGVHTEEGISLIKEIGNIVIASYANALSLILRKMIILPLPILISSSMEDVLNIIFSPYKDQDHCFLIEAVFEEPDENITGCFYFVLTPAAVSDIKQACKIMLEKLEK